MHRLVLAARGAAPPLCKLRAECCVIAEGTFELLTATYAQTSMRSYSLDCLVQVELVIAIYAQTRMPCHSLDSQVQVNFSDGQVSVF